MGPGADRRLLLSVNVHHMGIVKRVRFDVHDEKAR